MADLADPSYRSGNDLLPKWWENSAWEPIYDNQGQILSLILGVTLWEIFGRLLDFAFLPPFSIVITATWELIVSGEIWGSLAASLLSLAIGYALASSLGVIIGVLMGRYRKIEHLLDIYIYAFLASPGLIYVPILFAIFGTGRTTQIAVVFIYSFFLIVTHTFIGIRNVDARLIAMALSLGASERQLFWQVMLPGSLPLTMTGLRLGMARAVKGMINGEMFIALVGMGALIRTYGSRFDAAKVLALLLIVISIALITTTFVQQLDKHLTRWST